VEVSDVNLKIKSWHSWGMSW